MGKGKDRRGERVEDYRGREGREGGGEKWEIVRGGREGRRDM